ncbi:APC family permease [Salinisphaera sp. Q1T1-3]|uniref:APC family permease n=1 Tax=Salinisphaera sp. Q1T1-3 TaxID=2321229 RepID=UPI000E710187|nr:APC family permease [Salinisphaera sp. Q1T1-3]RJS94046.1 APC family permease [Salinisphaera sp. Q1T1-3]
MATSSAAGGKLRQSAGPIGLLFASTTSMIGSGWLFGAYHAAKLAGPWSILSWIIGAVIILMLAFCFAELATMFPRSGALVHISHASHGSGLGRIWGWMLFLAYVPIPPVEAEAIVTYANNYLPFLVSPDNGVLTVTGFIVSALLIGLLAWLNLLAVRTLLKFNSAVTWWKIFVPVATIIGLIVVAWHPENMHAAPGSYQISGIFTALPAAGIVFSFLGFRTAIDLAGESSNPNRYMPFAVIGSVILASIVYVGLQVAFIMSINPSELGGGWAALSFAGDLGPFAGLAAGLGMTWLAAILYIDAYVSPGGTGLMFLTGGSRILMANGRLKAGPSGLARLNSQGVPWVGVLVMWVVGCLFLLPFPAWQKMVGYITSITVLTYGIGPVVLLCLRRNAPDVARPFKLAGANILAPIAFILSNWIIYWAGFYTNSVLFILIGIGFVIYALYYHFVARMPGDEFGWRHIAWLAPWFGGIWLLSALGDIGNGLGVLGFVTELILLAIWSLVVMWIAYRTALTPSETQHAIDQILADEGSESAHSLT